MCKAPVLCLDGIWPSRECGKIAERGGYCLPHWRAIRRLSAYYPEWVGEQLAAEEAKNA
jgi:hypothetical protein